jgi:hypothetical protein
MADDAKQLQEDFKELERLASKLGKSVNFSNLKNDAEAVKELLKAWKKEVDEINREFSDLSSTFKNVIDDLRGFSSTSSNINKSFKTLGGLSDKLKYDTEDINRLNKKDLENLQKKARIEISNLKASKESLDYTYKNANLNEIEKIAKREGLKDTLEEIAQYKELQGIFDENNNFREEESNYLQKLLNLTTARLKEEERVQEQLGLVGVAAKGLVSTLSKFGIDNSYFSDLDKKLEEATRNGENAFETLGKEIKTNLTRALNDPLVQFAIGLKLVKSSFNDIKKVFNIFLEYNKIFVETARSLGMTTSQITEMTSQANFAGRAFSDNFYTAAQITKAIAESNAQLGLSVDLGKDTTREFAAMTNQMGLSAEEATKIYKLGLLTNTSLEDTNKSIAGGIIAAQKQFGVQINQRQVFQEIGKLSAGITSKFQQNPEALAKAVVQAKALGTNLEQVEKVGESLLNFESSIENELKAELLTGKQINVEKARYAALTGDQATLTAELADQVGSLGEFQEMNVLAQKSLAEAFGLSRDEVADMLIKQETFNKLGDVSKKSAQEQLEIARKRGISEEDSLMKNLQQQAAAEKIDAAFDRLKSTLAGIVDGPLGDIVNFMAKLLSNSYAVYGILGVALAGSIVKLVLGFGQLIKVARVFKSLEIGSAIASAAKAAFSSPLAMVTGGLAGLGILGVLTGAIMAATNVQQVEDGMAPSNKGPFTITDAYGSTAVTTTGDGVVVSPNINRDSINRPTQPSFNTSAITDAIATLSNTVSGLVNRPNPTPQFALNVDGRVLGTVVGRQMETGTSQVMNTGYQMA